MISAQSVGPLGMRRRAPLSGGLGGIDPGVKALQEELGNLSTQVGNSDIAPDRNDGTMSLGTIIALSHAAGAVGTSINPALGKAVDVVNIIKSPLEKIPYAGQVIDIVLSPWIVDNVFDTILSIMGIIPGAGDAASATRSAVDSFKQVLAGAASSIASGIALARKSIVKPPLGSAYPSSAWYRSSARRNFGDPETVTIQRLVTPTSSTRATVQVTGSGCNSGQYKTPAGTCSPAPSCPTGQKFSIVTQKCTVFETHNHSTWAKGHAIVPSEWSKTMQYRGHAAPDDLADSDRKAFAATALRYQSTFPSQGAQIQTYLAKGVVAFRTFIGADGTRMGAFYNVAAQQLSIVPLPPPPPRRSSIWGDLVNAVGGAIDYTSDALGDAANATGHFLGDLWSSISDQVEFVYDAVKKYGCALVGSDIVVGLAAAGAGIVATPATSAAIVSGAGAGRVACAAIEVGELVYKILKLLSTDFPGPPPPPGTSNEMVIAGRLIVGGSTKAPTGQIVIPLPTSKYKKGSIARFNTTRRVWVVYMPLVGGFGDGEVTPAVPAGFVKAGEELAPPAGLRQVGSEADKTPFWRTPVFWAVVGGGTAILAGGYLIMRRRAAP